MILVFSEQTQSFAFKKLDSQLNDLCEMKIGIFLCTSCFSVTASSFVSRNECSASHANGESRTYTNNLMSALVNANGF